VIEKPLDIALLVSNLSNKVLPCHAGASFG
jgi:hypothetical protein